MADISLKASLQDNMSKGLDGIADAMKQLIDLSKKQIELQINTQQVLNANKNVETLTSTLGSVSSISQAFGTSFDGITQTLANFDGTAIGVIKTIGSVAAQLTLMPFKVVVAGALQLGEAFISLGKSLFEMIGGFGGFISGLASLGSSMISVFTGGFSGIVNSVTSLGSSLTSAFSGITEIILSPFKLIGSAISSTLSGIGSIITTPFTVAFNAISSIGSTVFNALKNPIDLLLGVMSGGISIISNFGRAFEMLGNISELLDIYSNAKEIFMDFLNTLKMGVEIVYNFASACVDMTKDFDKQISNVASVSGATAEEMQKLRQAALDVGADTSLSSAQAAEALYSLGSAGYATEDAINALNGVAKLSEATQSDLAASTEIVVATLAQFKLGSEKATTVANVFTKGCNVSMLTIERLGDAMKYVGPVAGAMNMSLEQTVGVLSQLSNKGIQGEMAGNALKGALSTLISPAGDAVKVLQELGVSTELMAKNVESAKTTGINPFTATLTELQNKGISTAQIMRLFGESAGPSMINLLSGSIAEIDKLSSEVTGTNAAFDAAKVQLDNYAGACLQLSGSVESLQITLGTPLQKPLQIITEIITSVVNGFTDFIHKTGLLKAAGDVLTFTMSLVAKSFEAISNIISPAATMFAGYIKNISDAVSKLITFIETTKEFKQGWESITKVSQAFETLGSTMKKSYTETIEVINGVTTITKTLDKASASTSSISNTFSKIFKTLPASVTAVQNLGNVSTNTSNVLVSFKNNVWTITEVLTNLTGQSTLTAAIIDIVKTGFIALNMVIVSIYGAVINLASGFTIFIKNLMTLVPTSSTIQTTMLSLATTLANMIADVSRMAAVWLASSAAIDTVKLAFDTFIAIITVLPSVAMSVVTIFLAIQAACWTLAPYVLQVADYIARLVLQFLGLTPVIIGTGDILSGLTAVFTSTIEWITNLIAKFLSLGLAIIEENNIIGKLCVLISEAQQYFMQWFDTLKESELVNKLSGYLSSLGIYFQNLITQIQPFIPTFDELTAKFTNISNVIQTTLIPLIPVLVASFMTLIAVFNSIYSAVQQYLQPAIDLIKSSFTDIGAGNFEAAFQALLEIPKTYFPQITETILSMSSAFTDAFTTVMKPAAAAAATGGQEIQAAVQTTNAGIQTESEKMPSIFSTIGQALPAVFIGLVSAIVAGFNTAISAVKAALLPFASQVGDGLKTGLNNAWLMLPESTRTGIVNMITGIGAILKICWDIFVKTIPTMFSSFYTAFSDWWKSFKFDNSITGWIASLISVFTTSFSAFADTITNLVVGITPVLVGAFAIMGYGLGEVFGPIFITLLASLIAGIGGFLIGALDAIGSMFSKFFNGAAATCGKEQNTLMGAITSVFLGLTGKLLELVAKLFTVQVILSVIESYWQGFSDLVVLYGTSAMKMIIKGLDFMAGKFLFLVGSWFNWSNLQAVLAKNAFFANLIEHFTKSAAPLITAIISFGGLLLDAFNGVMSKLVSGDWIGAVSQFLGNVANMFTVDLGKTLQRVIDGLLMILSGWTLLILAVLNPIIDALAAWAREKFGFWGEVCVQVLGGVVKTIVAFFAGGPAGLYTGILAGLESIGKILKTFGVDWTKTWEFIKTTFKTVWDNIKSVGNTAYEGLKSTFSKIEGIVNSISNALSTVTNKYNELKTVTEGIGNLLTTGSVVGGGNIQLGPAMTPQANGGIIKAHNGGTAVLAAESGMNEAFVPLPDGRSIPVSMPDLSALTQSNNSGSISINFGNVNINNDTDANEFYKKVEESVSNAILRKTGRR